MKLCVYTVSIEQFSPTISINEEWAISNGYTFYSFHTQTLDANVFHPTWEKVVRANEIMQNKDCEVIMWIDSDAVINNPYFPITKIINHYPEKTFIGACNSPTGSGFQCDSSCCHVRRQTRCLEIHDIGDYSPYPCLMNAGVFFIRNTPKGKRFVNHWLQRHSSQIRSKDPFYEQEVINEIRGKHANDFAILGGQVFNTHSLFDPTHWSFHSFNRELRSYTGFLETRRSHKILNQEQLIHGKAPCIGSSSFLCHSFARVDKEYINYSKVERIENHDYKVAVCVSGTTRTLFTEQVQLSFLKLHRPEFEYFLSTEITHSKDVMFGPIRSWVMRNMDSFSYDDLKCAQNSCMHIHLLTMVQRYAYCFHSIQTYEYKNNFQYTYIFRLRPDHVIYTHVPPLHTFVRPGKIHLWDDQFAMAHRKDAMSILSYPSLAYSTCYDSRMWRKICGRPIHLKWRCEMGVPCEAMRSISLYTNVSINFLDWTMKRVSTNSRHDFCIHRLNVRADVKQHCISVKDSDNVCSSCNR